MARPTHLKRIVALAISLAVRTCDIVRTQARRWSGLVEPRSGVVLYYHAITLQQRSSFAWQMDELLRHASPFEAGAPEGMPQPGNNVAVTFDDGFQSVVDNGVPELAERGIPFTMFVPSGCLGQRPSWVRDAAHPSWHERVLSGDALRSLASQPLATIGSHSITHPNFLTLGPADAEREFAGSRERLEAAACADVDLFSFPHGAYDEALLEQARRAGYRRVYTVEPQVTTAAGEAYAIGRVAVSPDDWRLEFRLKMLGAYRWRSSLRRLRGRP